MIATYIDIPFTGGAQIHIAALVILIVIVIWICDASYNSPEARKQREARRREEEYQRELEQAERERAWQEQAPQREIERHNRAEEEQKARALQGEQERITAELRSKAQYEQHLRDERNKARVHVANFHIAHAAMLEEVYPYQLLYAALYSEIPESGDQDQAWNGARKLIAELKELITQQRARRVKEVLKEHKRRQSQMPTRSQIEQEIRKMLEDGFSEEAIAAEIENRYPGFVFEDAADTQDLYGS